MARNPSQDRERGAVAVELALVLPILVLLLFGIIEFGRAYNAKIELQGAVRDGARALAIGPAAGDPVAITKGSASNLSPVSVTTSGSPCTKGQQATVTATYDLPYTIPLFASGTWTLTAKGQMRCGG
jgi:Flp pilus assembly protein TadG